jgi:tetratricopeptide (TPR) repeat protein
MAEAEAYFRRALSASSLNALWAYNLAELLMARGAVAEASAAYGEAMRIDPSWSEPLYKAGLAHLQMGQTSKAAASLRAFLKIEPRSVRATEVRGMLEDLDRK